MVWDEPLEVGSTSKILEVTCFWWVSGHVTSFHYMWTKQTHVNELTFQERSRLRGTEISTTLFGSQSSAQPTIYTMQTSLSCLKKLQTRKPPTWSTQFPNYTLFCFLLLKLKMAASLATQSMLASPVAARVTGIRRSGVNQLSSVKYLPSLRRNVKLSVRCTAEVSESHGTTIRNTELYLTWNNSFTNCMGY